MMLEALRASARRLPLAVLAGLVAGVVLAPGWARATHYPDGAFCYDCHAVSKGKMVSGTHLIKASQRTISLGIDANGVMRCLFCHATGAVSVPLSADRAMRPVDSHFTSASLSKHRASVQSTVLAQDVTLFDCKDCHVAGVDNSVTSDTSGNTFVHGKDAKTQRINVYTDTLLGSPAVGTTGVYKAPSSLTTAERKILSAATCANDTCHSATGPIPFGPYTAPKRHGYAKGITLNDVAFYTSADDPQETKGCLGCHGTHNSVDGASLLVLKNTSGANGKAATNATVKPDECEVCHSQDENGTLVNNYIQYGHGKVGVNCATCHGVSHTDAGHTWLEGSRLKPELAEDTAAGTSTFGTSFYSNCKKCHASHMAHTPTPASGGFRGSSGFPAPAGNTGRSAGCRDCHDPHGTTVADAAATNDTMLRRSLGANGALPAEDTRLPPVGAGRPGANSQWFVFGQTYGACDNSSCHTKIQLTAAGATLATTIPTIAHLGGALSATSCATTAGCHTTHTTAAADGQFGAAQDCDGCHASSGVAHTRTGASPGTHDGHVGSPYVASHCDQCHPHSGPGTAGDAAHLNGTVDFGGPRMTSAGFPSYAVAGGSLSAAGCNTAANGCHNAPPASWVTPALLTNCADCHAATGKLLYQGGWPVATNKHTQHLGSNSLPQTGTSDCFSCHDTTLDSSGGLKAGGAHLNAVKDVAFNAAYSYEGAAGSRTGTGATTTCASVRCHNGVTTPSWAAASTIACGQCHNTGGTGPVPTGAGVAGSHAVHAQNVWPTPTCDACHGASGVTVSGTYTATGGGGAGKLHQNLTVEVWINGAANRYVDAANTAGGVNWNAAGATHVDDGTCSATVCHGTGTPVWGATLANGCFACHDGAAAVEPLANPVEPAGNGPNVVKQTQYEAAGHGNTTTYAWDSLTGAKFSVGNRETPNKGCSECHSSAALHAPTKSPTDPYRLGAWATNTNGLCNDCHGPSATNPRKALSPLNLSILGHDKATVGSSKDWPPTGATEYAYKCVDCHDPHGDANHYMVKDALSAPTGVADTTMGSNGYGTPLKNDAGMSAVTFISLTGKADNSYADTAPSGANGICEVCHTQTTYYNRGDLGTQSHFPTVRCTSCHTHNGGFKASCTGCHGGGIATEGNNNVWPDSQATHGTTWPNRLGSHTNHVTRIAEVKFTTATPTTAQKNLTCDYCHPTGEHSGDEVAPAEVADGTAGKQLKDILGRLDTGGARNWVNATTVYCANTDCHYNGKGAVTTGTPNWYGGGISCDSCHREWTFGAAYNPGDLPNAHDVHTDDAAYKFNCFTCHPPYFTMDHQNGVVDLNYDSSASRVGGLGVTDTNAVFSGGDRLAKYGGSGSYVTCQNFYCHGDRRGGNAYAPHWNVPTDGDCGTCHGSTAGTDPVTKAYPRTGPYVESHLDHIGSNSQPGCSSCHEGTGTVGLGTYGAFTQHVRGVAVNVVFGAAKNETVNAKYEALTATYAGVIGGTPAGTETCANVSCHNGVVTPSFNLTGGVNITCGKCHNETWTAAGTGPLPTGGASVAGSHAKHANNDAVYADCALCHAGAATYTAVGPLGGTHQDLAVQVTGMTAATYADVVNTAGGVNWSSLGGTHVDDGTCTFTGGCHGSGKTPVWGAAGSVGCGSCHGTTVARTGYLDPTADKQGAPPTDMAGGTTGARVGKHLNHLNLSYSKLTDSCTLCHTGAGSGSGLHANGVASGGGVVANVAFEPTYAGATAAYNGVSCSGLNTTYCHGGTVPWTSTTVLACSACHDGPSAGAPKVVSAIATPHVKATTGQATFGGCEQCHAGHVGATGTITIPLPPASITVPGSNLSNVSMRTRLGIDYTIHSGIAVGGSATGAPASEAEFCWGCHGTNDAVNEWGYNQDTSPGTFPVTDIAVNASKPAGAWAPAGSNLSYNYGWLYTTSGRTTLTGDWTGTDGKGAYRRDGYDNTINRRIASVHSANFDAGGQSSSVANNVDVNGKVKRGTAETGGGNAADPVLESRSSLRCSYCHDVHDLNKANGGAGLADASSGRPYLRGAWTGNPYPPDVPPLAGYTYGTNYFVSQQTAMPRLKADNAGSKLKGGYFIDQNSGDPSANTAYNTLTKTSGLCVLCHGDNVDDMDFYTGSNLWRGVNGHSNAVLAGKGTSKRNIFDARRGLTQWYMAMQDQINAKVNNTSPPWGSTLRSNKPQAARNSGWYMTPPSWASGGTSNSGGSYTAWYYGNTTLTTAAAVGVYNTGQTPLKAHNFTCSKCHSPHATGLPALLTTNCLDVTLSTWYAAGANYGAAKVKGTVNQANTCHSKLTATPTADGWIKLAPGQ
ncbi:MAG: CxxxxCH/CxxCH domain-containing protein [Deltaproteobacteria bacterium]|nr:CxxxxCH/CxxCH domain-containing protein [Deltaproteobacteria bacterium]